MKGRGQGMANRIRGGAAVAIGVASLLAAAPAQGQSQGAGGASAGPQAQGTETISARVTATVPGTGITIDRGTGDGVQLGDRVLFSERGGTQQFGTVIELEGRAAVVRPEDPSFRPGPGVRATITVPASRFDEPEMPTTKVPVSGQEAPAPSAGDKPKPEWSNKDESWEFDMPLLAEVGAVKTWNRPPSYSGRTYLSLDHIIDSEDDRGDTFLRAGGGFQAENAFGKGGLLHFDGEWNARRASLPFENDESDRTFRLDRLSYTLGGNRHDPTRVQFGRFLQDGMPEFGILDGASFGRRLESGNSYGLSAGFLPEPDKDQQSLEDFQLSAWYRWVQDETERFTITGGYQKTWHNETRDRDLLVARLQYAPVEGWNVYSTMWIDLYGVGDNVKSSGPELTYMILDARKKLSDTTGVDLEYRHQAYPELRRADFPPVGLQQIENARVDRASATMWRWLRPRDGANGRNGMRVFGRAGGWLDEEDSGGDGEIGLEFYDTFQPGGRLDIAGFTSAGKFSSLIGGRIRYGHYGAKRSWSALYEIRLNDITGFGNDTDDQALHRIRGSYEFYRSSGLSASFSAEAQFQDLEDQVFLGFFLQRTF